MKGTTFATKPTTGSGITVRAFAGWDFDDKTVLRPGALCAPL